MLSRWQRCLAVAMALCFEAVSLPGTEFWNPADSCSAQVLDKRAQLEKQTFWDNRDWEWYEQNIPFFECPDADLTTTYYYRWELITKHLTYGSPNSGYSYREFIDRPFWSGAYGAISCPAGHQLYEVRWLKDSRYSQDYLRYWFRTPGAQPRNYSTWLADSAWAMHQVRPSRDLLVDLLPDLIRNHKGWEARHYVPEVGLFWQTGHDDGMEFNINSRQTTDILRGAPSFRPSFNAYMWADMMAISRIAELTGDETTAQTYREQANRLRETMQNRLWDPKRQFFFPMARDNEERDGFKVEAGSLTYQTGQFAGSPYGRELIGFVPWQFNMLESGKGYETAWKTLMDPEGFFAPFGPMTVERRDPMFLLQNWCCWWSGQSWPYATTQTLKGMANLIQSQVEAPVTADDYLRLLQIYSKTHRMNGRPFLAEACHPETGSFEGHNGYNHSEHYFHSAFNDLVITGLMGVVPRVDSALEIRPLVPQSWDWWALDDMLIRGHRVSVFFDRDGSRYSRGKGFQIEVDGKVIYQNAEVQDVTLENALPGGEESGGSAKGAQVPVNFAVNNDGTYFPRISTTWSSPQTPISKVVDGNFWYHQHPPNRWTTDASRNSSETITVDLGTERSLTSIRLLFLDDEGEAGSKVRVPESARIEIRRGDEWIPLTGAAAPAKLSGHRPNSWVFDSMPVRVFRVQLTPQPGSSLGLTELEAWGLAELPVQTPEPPSGNLALRAGEKNGQEFPKATASFTSRFDQVERVNDGITMFLPNPANRWTTYESKSTSDWLQIDFGKPTEFRRVELAIYDDRGGVQPPESYQIEYRDGETWKPVENLHLNPEKPAGGQWNTATFSPVTAEKMRVVFQHRGDARSGLTELLIWNTTE